MFGDHGWHLAEMEVWCKCTNFELATRAPLLIRVPGVTDAGVTSTTLSEHVDLLPTLAEAAGMLWLGCPSPPA
jgi:arylsulfatase A-like enzyme